MVSAKKLFICVPEVIVVGQRCTYEGRIQDQTKVSKILSWPTCESKMDVWAFLGTTGTVQNWIKNYAAISRPLTDLTRNNTPFIWTNAAQSSMNMLKIAVTESPTIRPINYLSPNEVILSVDSSYLACSWILLQLDDNGKRRPACFGSITWNKCKSRYSQAKVELYGLFHTLEAAKVWLIGVKKFTVEVDTKYIKGMLNNPDIQLNAAMNCWITGILMFDFTLKHVLGSKHQGPDGLSCRRHAPEDNNEDDESSDDIEEWIDEILGCDLWVANNLGSGYLKVVTHTTVLQFAETPHLSDLDIPSNDASHSHDEELQILRTYL